MQRIPLAAALAVIGAVSFAPSGRADEVAYLVNVTVRPGYGFANAADALNYGYGICDEVASGRAFSDIVDHVKDDFRTGDEYHASYVISQSVNELCPRLIWQVRNSAANYRPLTS
ncbi:membrane protein [Mycolicibacterium setense]|nr:membrane protein [Mycolicibacterium setense]